MIKYGFFELAWRQGGADNGRDIEGYLNFTNQIGTTKTKWFFECKHYTNGVPPDQLSSKVTWADLEKPDYLVFFVSSYITTAARTWIEGIQRQKGYRILVLEGVDLKSRLVQFPDLVERFFTEDRLEKPILLNMHIEINCI